MSKQFNRQRRHNNRSNRSVVVQKITRYTNLDSSGPLGKLRGTPLQLAEKYQAGAKDAQTQGDDVLFQTCQQYADHYLRLQAIAIENEQSKVKPEESTPEEVFTDLEEVSSPVSEDESESVMPQPAVEKRVVKHHKKEAEDSLSMPMEALQAQSEIVSE